MKNSHPIYIPSKGRYEKMLTADTLKAMGCDYYVVVEPKEYDLYRTNEKHKNNLLVLDLSYKDTYELLDEHGLTKSTGPGPARNFAWQHSIDQGHKWHWVMDDNIDGFARLNNNKRHPVQSAGILKAMEDFCNRYENVAMAGPEYRFFAPERSISQPFKLNTRIYSCNLIRNDINLRWRGRYNEDTILSLDMLEQGYCTVSFYAFLQNKLRTSTLGGGNTEEFYDKEGTLPKSKMLVDVYPQYSTLVHKFQRWHHHVDYSGFKNLPILKAGHEKINRVNEYGMKFIERQSKTYRSNI